MLAINPPFETRNLVQPAVEFLSQGTSIAMLSLVNIEGSAPYPLGSQMLVTQDGKWVGQITGGCAESALADQALEAIKQGQNQTQRYGAGSPFFDIQLPCGSGIDVVLDVTTTLEQYQSCLQRLNNRQIAELSLQGGYIKRYQPTERLVVCGQGPILSALAVLARNSGFEVCVLVQDQAQLKELEMQGVSASYLYQDSITISHELDSFSAMVSLFHEHEREIELLQQALSSSAFYVGALGSKRTHANRIESLNEAGLSDEQIQRIHGPVGLDIGAETPAQIAISILAQVIECLPKQNSLEVVS